MPDKSRACGRSKNVGVSADGLCKTVSSLISGSAARIKYMAQHDTTLHSMTHGTVWHKTVKLKIGQKKICLRTLNTDNL